MVTTQTALIVPIPEAEAAVGRHRTTLDKAAGWGVPAHVTVLYPFLPPAQITGAVLADLREVIGRLPGFGVSFGRVEWFGRTLAWLAPEPDAPFRELTSAVWRRFPAAPPYGGKHGDPDPHLTIGHDAPFDVLTRAADGVRPFLPIEARVDAVQLFSGSAEPNSWTRVETIPLGPGDVVDG